MSPRLTSSSTSRPLERAYSQTSSSARIPSDPSASKNAACGFTATTYGPTASTIPLQKRTTAAAAEGRPSTASPRSSIGSTSRSGSSPTTSWLRLRATASARRSANAVVSCTGTFCRRGAAGGPGYASRTSGGEDLARVERDDPELRSGSPQEARDDEQVGRILGREGELRARSLREPGIDLEPAGRPLGDRPRGRDAPLCDEERAPEALLTRGSEHADPKLPQTGECLDPRDRIVERRQPVAVARGVLEAEVAREPQEPGPARCERRCGMLALEAVERACRESGTSLARERAQRTGLGDDRPPVLPSREVAASLWQRRARIRGRTKLADEPQLRERRLELGPELSPLHPLQCAERGLDRRPLPAAGEVGAQPRAEVAGLSHVEDGVVLVAEEVDAGRARRAGDEGPSRVQAPRTWGAELEHLGERPRSSLLREPEQGDQDLRGRERIRQRAMARRRRGAEEVREGGE